MFFTISSYRITKDLDISPILSKNGWDKQIQNCVCSVFWCVLLWKYSMEIYILAYNMNNKLQNLILGWLTLKNNNILRSRRRR